MIYLDNAYLCISHWPALALRSYARHCRYYTECTHMLVLILWIEWIKILVFTGSVFFSFHCHLLMSLVHFYTVICNFNFSLYLLTCWTTLTSWYVLQYNANNSEIAFSENEGSKTDEEEDKAPPEPPRTLYNWFLSPNKNFNIMTVIKKPSLSSITMIFLCLKRTFFRLQLCGSQQVMCQTTYEFIMGNATPLFHLPSKTSKAPVYLGCIL